MKLTKQKIQLNHYMDGVLFCCLLALLSIGFVAVASSSIVVAEKNFGEPFYYAVRQLIYISLGFSMMMAVWHVPLSLWQRYAKGILLSAFALLVIVLMPGIGKTLNGATRWIYLGPMSIQVSEVAKLAMIVYLASFISRYQQDIQNSLAVFVKPVVVLGLMILLLLLQPDFGACVVISMTCLIMLFMAETPSKWFFALFGCMTVSLLGLAVSAPYRLARLTTFLDPWAFQFDAGYQLTQALIAFGRGSWFGVGLGASVQKLFYLPEAHSDFVYAIIAEETGLVGSIVLVVLYLVLGYRAWLIAKMANSQENIFGFQVAIGVGLWLMMQALINVGVNSGLLPTKGLTLPLISAGGSSLLVNLIAVGLLLRVDYEARRAYFD